MITNKQYKKKLLVVSGPSGSGKSTIGNMLCERKNIDRIIRHTTRPKDPREKEGEDYYFVDTASFKKMTHNDEFIQWNKYEDGYSGTNISVVNKTLGKADTTVIILGLFDALKMFEHDIFRIKKIETMLFFIAPCAEQTFRHDESKYVDILKERVKARNRSSDNVSDRVKKAKQDRLLYLQKKKDGLKIKFIDNGENRQKEAVKEILTNLV